METVRDFIFLGSKITADGDCSHEIKRCLLASPGLIYETGHLRPVHWDDPEGWDGEGGGRGEQDGGHMTWLIHVNIWQKPLQYSKALRLQLKLINFKKLKLKKKKVGHD